MKVRWRLLFGFLLLTTTPVDAGEPSSFQGFWDAVTHNPNCKAAQFPDFILLTCEREQTLWYFTKPNHPAHPGVIRRYLYEKDGTWYAKEDGHSFASNVAQPAFKAWLAQIVDLDRQAREWIKTKRSQNPTGHSN